MAGERKIMGRDMNKFGRPYVAEIGGLPVSFGFLSGFFFYILCQCILKDYNPTLKFLNPLLTIILCGAVGLVDDILGWRKGLSQKQKIWLPMFMSLPLAMMVSGRSEIGLPIIGTITIGIIYPLVLVPLAVSWGANAFNILAGYNGLEAKMGITILTILGIICLKIGETSVAMLSFCMVAALMGFLNYNRYPARIFPGNTLTYLVGATISVVSILSRIEIIALILFIPYFIQFILKARSRFQKESFARPLEDDTLEIPYGKFYALEHVAIWLMKKSKKRVLEQNVSTFFLITEMVLGGVTLAVVTF